MLGIFNLNCNFFVISYLIYDLKIAKYLFLSEIIILYKMLRISLRD